MPESITIYEILIFSCENQPDYDAEEPDEGINFRQFVKVWFIKIFLISWLKFKVLLSKCVKTKFLNVLASTIEIIAHDIIIQVFSQE